MSEIGERASLFQFRLGKWYSVQVLLVGDQVSKVWVDGKLIEAKA